MAANRKKQDDKNLEILRELITISGNKYCLDCNQRGPTYVNTTIGSFVCSKCSGMLRGLTPPHRVKSISMATFTPEEIEFIKNRGNDYCRRLWLGLFEGDNINFTDEQGVRDFMVDKYEKKRYYLESNANNQITRNGNASFKSNINNKTGSTTNSTPLIAITPQLPKPTFANTGKTVNNLMPIMNEPNQRTKPANSFMQAFVNNTSNSVTVVNSVPDFPVDFSTAEIYNSSQYNNNNNLASSNYLAQPSNSSLSFSVSHPPASTSKKSNTTSKNPFQSSTTSNVFADKNPFFNGTWNTSSVPIQPVNPFMVSFEYVYL
ncbi:hypothetical protein EVAR_3271_1 [Eumeta japonica]|uniref:Arf-GAP domain-containing protein n=1 Tax=Eumeta variegata TaxID=151549 RepID=A0A4C1SXX6_EUMVA|nr:hypothetical protein EVAR_3271_1 [Eumeta japonica]